MAEVDRAQLDASVLDEEERSRAARLRGGERTGFLAAHILLRQLLGRRLGVAPGVVAYRREACPRCGAPRGRPALDGPGPTLHFSLSRRAGVVLIALAPVAVGVDVEAVPPDATVADVAELLHPAEREQILAAGAATRAEVFTRLWARKEAYLKGIGTGVAHDLGADYLGTDELVPGPPGWTVVEVPVASGYGAAVAVQSTATVSAPR
ncbi:MAG: 4'-phosphopantetheinyl transferase superfamily protein [Actinomycetota bacterium]|nr:4'-phosphopantetheinyl transferase superfamily protein [Actinomycetota bacterium]